MSDSDAANIIKAVRLYRQIDSFNIAARALFVWDYVITFDNEVQYVWGRKPTIATVLFMVNRYVNLAATIFQIFVQAGFQRDQSCRVVVRFVEAEIIISLLIFALFFALRIYATWGRDWRPALPVLVLALVPPATNLYIYCKSVPALAPPPAVGCASEISITSTVYQDLVVTNRACTTAYDFLVVVLTFTKTLGAKKSRQFEAQTPLVMLLLRDGTLYFLLMFILNIAQIIVASRPDVNNALAYFIAPLTSILISRFLLNLRQIYLTENRDATSVFLNTSIFTAEQFHSEIIGNIGEQLDWGTPVSSTVVDSDEDMKPTLRQEPSLDSVSRSGLEYELSQFHNS